MAASIVLLHGSANGAYSWGPVLAGLAAAGASAYAPDMIGYGRAPAPSPAYGIVEEVSHLRGLLDRHAPGPIHLVTHSLGTMFGLHLRRALGDRVVRLTLVDPIVVSVLREGDEPEAYAEMEAQYQRFHAAAGDPAAAAERFVDHWNGAGAWRSIGERARAVIAGLAPKVGLEMDAARGDRTALAALAEAPPPTRIVLGGATRIAAVATGRQLARAFHGVTEVVDGAGHMVPLTHPAAVVDAILRGEAEDARIQGDAPPRSISRGGEDRLRSACGGDPGV
ncbi:MAG: alpha/beta hydrolase [Nannocystaceae bacterium]